MGRQGSVGGPPPQGPVPVLAGLMDGNGCSIGTHILSYKPPCAPPAGFRSIAILMDIWVLMARCHSLGSRPRMALGIYLTLMVSYSRVGCVAGRLHFIVTPLRAH